MHPERWHPRKQLKQCKDTRLQAAYPCGLQLRGLTESAHCELHSVPQRKRKNGSG
jgi:hypothetical protein